MPWSGAGSRSGRRRDRREWRSPRRPARGPSPRRAGDCQADHDIRCGTARLHECGATDDPGNSRVSAAHHCTAGDRRRGTCVCRTQGKAHSDDAALVVVFDVLRRRRLWRARRRAPAASTSCAVVTGAPMASSRTAARIRSDVISASVARPAPLCRRQIDRMRRLPVVLRRPHYVDAVDEHCRRWVAPTRSMIGTSMPAAANCRRRRSWRPPRIGSGRSEYLDPHGSSPLNGIAGSSCCFDLDKEGAVTFPAWPLARVHQPGQRIAHSDELGDALVRSVIRLRAIAFASSQDAGPPTARGNIPRRRRG